jgi:hypothetical protein
MTNSNRKIYGWIGLAFLMNLVGSLAMWGIANRPDPNNHYAEENALYFLLIFGTVWAAIASYVTMLVLSRTAKASSISNVQFGLAIAITTLPLSVLLNLPSSTPNPVAALGGNLMKYVDILFAASIMEYFVIAYFAGLALIKLGRMAGIPTDRVVAWVWTGTAILYLLQVPLTLAVSGNLR